IYNYGDTLLSNTTFIDSINKIVKAEETVTNVSGSNGVYTYTNENGDAQKIDVVSDIYNYGDTLLSNTTFIDSINKIVKAEETVTNVSGSNGVYTYTNENGDAQKIDVVSDIYNYGDTLLSNTTFIDSINKIVKAEETVTNVSGSNGVYTYTNENGDAQKIDVVSDIYNYGDTLLSNTTFIDSINKIVKAEETVTNVSGSNGVYTYTNENGTAQKIDVVSDIYNYGDTLLSNTTFIDSINKIVKAEETVTNVSGSNGVYTYTNENGDAQTIDVVSDIYNYGDTLLSNTTFIDSINKIVKAEETVTTLTKNGNVYTYTNEKGDTQDIVSQKYYAGFGLTATNDTIFNVKPVEIADSIARAINNTILKDTIINLVKDNSVKVKMLEIAMDSIIGTQSKIFFGTTASNAETIEVVGIEPIFTGNRVMRLTKLKVNASAELNAAKTTVDWSVTIDNDNIIAADTCTLHKVVISYICKNDITNNTTGSYNIAGR
ncbi:MAG: hypothetical protein LBN27_06415, partial [Prevotellaceae bacterium]|nr:hypothetical protein [Prevotellaceae bacterium]